MKFSAVPTLVTAGALFAWAPLVSAEVVASDSYNGYAGGGLDGDSGVGEVGFSAAWSAGTANLQVESSGILDDDPLSGQGKFIPVGQAFGQYRGANRTLDPIAADPPNNTFYSSHLLFAGTSGGLVDEYALVGFGSFADGPRFEDTQDFLLGAFAGFVNNGTDVDLVVRTRTAPSAPGAVSDTVLATDVSGNTFNVVMALEYNNPGDEVRWWVDPTDFSNGETGLTDTASASGAIAGFQLGGLSDMNRLTVGTTFTNRSFFWDESVLATAVADLADAPTGLEGDYNTDGFVSQGDLDLVLLNWGDAVAPGGFEEGNIPGGGPFDGLMSQNELDGVLLNWGNGTPPPANAVPEPAAAALLGLGGLALLRRRSA